MSFIDVFTDVPKNKVRVINRAEKQRRPFNQMAKPAMQQVAPVKDATKASLVIAKQPETSQSRVSPIAKVVKKKAPKGFFDKMANRAMQKGANFSALRRKV